MNVKATTFAIIDRLHKTLVSPAGNVDYWIDKAFAVAAFLAKFR